jgi:UDP-glucose 4-epimerase
MSPTLPIRVVTGGAGFIGSHLAETLLKEGGPVRVVDNLSTGREELVPRGAEFLRGDVNEVAAAAVSGADVVYHLAALPSVPRSVDKPLESHRATAEGTVRLLAAAQMAGVRRVVLASSSSVYGDTPILPKREDMPPKPLSPYAVAKLCGELHAQSWAAHTPLETVSLRFFNVFGPRQDPDSPYAAVIPLFVRRLVRGQPLLIFGDGRQTRDFTFVGDVVRGILAAGQAPGVSGRVYNLASGRQTSVLEVGQALERLMGRKARYDHQDPRPGDIRDSWADISAAQRDLGFRPGTPLEDGLRLTVDWFLK